MAVWNIYDYDWWITCLSQPGLEAKSVSILSPSCFQWYIMSVVVLWLSGWYTNPKNNVFWVTQSTRLRPFWLSRFLWKSWHQVLKYLYSKREKKQSRPYVPIIFQDVTQNAACTYFFYVKPCGRYIIPLSLYHHLYVYFMVYSHYSCINCRRQNNRRKTLSHYLNSVWFLNKPCSVLLFYNGTKIFILLCLA